MNIKQSLGEKGILNRHKIAFLCSNNSPIATKEAINRWVDELNPESDAVLCGNHSDLEQYLFRYLLENKIPTILFLAENLHDRWDDSLEKALKEQRLMIATHCDTSVHFTTAASAYDRNSLMIELADEIVVGYCTPNGKIEKQIAGYRNVKHLTAAATCKPHDRNENTPTVLSKPQTEYLQASRQRHISNKKSVFNIFRKLYIRVIRLIKRL